MTTTDVRHPAKFTDVLLQEIRKHVPVGARVLDPFAGTGRIHLIADDPLNGFDCDTVGVEIEPEWANLHPRTIVGDALSLPFTDASFDVIATSPCYGNRMADSHDAKERCSECKGGGRVHADTDYRGDSVKVTTAPCPKCNGTGVRDHKRITYTHTLGRKLHPNNSGSLQWGPKYRAFHEAAWAEVIRVLRPGGRFILNVSDHYRNHKIERVTAWHIAALLTAGLDIAKVSLIPTPRMGFGANASKRVPHETVALLVKP